MRLPATNHLTTPVKRTTTAMTSIRLRSANRDGLACTVLAGILALAAESPLQAASFFWNTTNGLWSEGANWSDADSGGNTGEYPFPADTATFNQSAVNGNQVIQVAGSEAIAGITFTNTGTTAISADAEDPRQLTIGTSGITVAGGAGQVTLGDAVNILDVMLGGTQTWNNHSSNPLLVRSNVTNGAGKLTTAGDIVLTSAFGGGNGALDVISGTLALNGLAAAAASNYTGATTLDGATLALGGHAALLGAINFGLANGSTHVSTLDLSNGSASFAGALTVRTNTAASNTIRIGSGRTLTNTGTITIGYQGAQNVPTLTSVTAAGNGNWEVIRAGGTLRVGGTSSTNRSETAVLDMSGLAAFTADLGATGSFDIGSQGTGNTATSPCVASLAAISTITANRLGIGYSAGTAQVHALKLGGGLQTLNINQILVGLQPGSNQRGSGSLSFNGPTGALVLRAADGTSGANLLLGQNASTTGADTSATFDVGDHPADILLNDFKVASRNGINNSGNRTQLDTFTFDTGTLTVTNQAIFADTQDLTGTNNQYGSSNQAIINLGGGTGGDGSAAFTGGILMARNASVYAGHATNRRVSTATLNLHANTGGSSFNAISGTITMGEMTGSNRASNEANATINLFGGTLTLTGNIVAGGAPTAGSATRSLNLAGGTLDLGGNSIGLAGALIDTLNFESGTLRNVAQINDGAGLTKTTAGTLILDGPNNYSGPTTINGGTLALAAGGSIPNSTSIMIAPGAVFDATAKASLAVPAAQPVTLHLDGTGSGSAGRIAAAGLDIRTANIVLTLDSPLDDPVYVLADYASLDGTAFLSVTPVPAYEIDYSHNGGTQIALVRMTPVGGYHSFITAAGLQDPWLGVDPALNGEPGADPDGDGLDNLVEYAIAGGNPVAPNAAAGTFTGTTLTVTKRKPLATDLVYSIETSADLGAEGWTAAVTHSPPHAFNAISHTLPLGSGRNFMRLKVAKTAP
ncbi:MAG: autotransporter-associated beta strand repeat-containing protein [Akkermansiaceae bacterium]|nr:autotransporter-associated beta strand repeat-containing protein [Akkermansiaceae bacterium]